MSVGLRKHLDELISPKICAVIEVRADSFRVKLLILIPLKI